TSPLVLPTQRATVRVRGPGTRFEACVGRWRAAEGLLGERHPGAQTLLRRLEHMFDKGRGRLGRNRGRATTLAPASAPARHVAPRRLRRWGGAGRARAATADAVACRGAATADAVAWRVEAPRPLTRWGVEAPRPLTRWRGVSRRRDR